MEGSWLPLLIRSAVSLAVLLAALLVFMKLFRVAGNVLGQARDHFVMWNVAFGAHCSRRNVSRRLRLHAYVCETALLDNSSLGELFRFSQQLVDSDISLDTYRRVVLSYTYVIICRERMDGSLRGICYLDKTTETISNQKCTLIKLGLALFDKLYQGGPLLYYILSYHILKEMLLHPTVKVYTLCKCYSFKSYLSFVHTVENVYPSYRTPVPNFERQLLNEFAESVRKPHEVYNPKTFVLERELSKVKDFVAPVTQEELKNPHIKFFIDNNPNWSKGHCMFCVAPVTRKDLLSLLWKSFKRAMGLTSSSEAKKRKKSQKFSSSYNRQLSFQTPDAKAQVLELYDVDSRGNVVPMFGTSADIYAPPTDIEQ